MQEKPIGHRLSTSSHPMHNARTGFETRQIGVDGEQTLGNGRSLRILIEKDFQCLYAGKRQVEYEFDSDAFPNPGRRHQEVRSE